jgi:hypothetical protein
LPTLLAKYGRELHTTVHTTLIKQQILAPHITHLNLTPLLF